MVKHNPLFVTDMKGTKLTRLSFSRIDMLDTGGSPHTAGLGLFVKSKGRRLCSHHHIIHAADRGDVLGSSKVVKQASPKRQTLSLVNKHQQ